MRYILKLNENAIYREIVFGSLFEAMAAKARAIKYGTYVALIKRCYVNKYNSPY